MGQNGREIPFSAPFNPAETDLMIVMLETNGLLQDQSPEQAAEQLERFRTGIPGARQAPADCPSPPPSLDNLRLWRYNSLVVSYC